MEYSSPQGHTESDKTGVTEHACTRPAHSGIVCSSRRPCLTSLATGRCLCFWALCLPALRHPSTLLLLGEPVSPLSASPVFRGLSCHLGLSDPEGPSQLFGTQRHCSFQKNPGTWGLSPRPPPRVCLGHSSGETLLFPAQGPKPHPHLSALGAALRGSGNSPWLFGPLAPGLWIRRH